MDDQNKQAPLQSEQKDEVIVTDSNVDPSEKLTPDHPRFKEVLSERNELRDEVSTLKSQMEELQGQIQSRQQETGDTEFTAEELAAIKKLEKAGFVKQDKLEEKERVLRRSMEYDRLSSKYNTAPGYPKFVPFDVQAHAKAKGFGDNLDAAYHDMHRDAILQVEVKKAMKQVEIPSSEKPTGGEHFVEAGIDLEKAKADPNYYAEHREAIHKAMKDAAKQASKTL